MLKYLLIIAIFVTLSIAFTNSTLMGYTHTVNNVTYKCAKSDDTLWLCFESFETFLGFNDLRVAFEYNPQTNTIGKVADNSDYYKSLSLTGELP